MVCVFVGWSLPIQTLSLMAVYNLRLISPQKLTLILSAIVVIHSVIR